MQARVRWPSWCPPGWVRPLDCLFQDGLGGHRAQLAGVPKLSRQERSGSDIWHISGCRTIARLNHPGCGSANCSGDSKRCACRGVRLHHVNALLLVTGQDAEQVVLCIFLTLVVTVTYLIGSRDHVTNSIRDHRWKELFTGLA